MDFDLVKLGRALQKIRLEKKYTLTDVANFLGITHKAVHHWEQGRNEIKLSHLVKLCEFYNITINELFELSDFID